MIVAILALMIPLAAVIAWSPVGRALARAIEANAGVTAQHMAALPGPNSTAGRELDQRVAMLETLVANLSTHLEAAVQDRRQLESRLALAEKALEKQSTLGSFDAPGGPRALDDGRGT